MTHGLARPARPACRGRRRALSGLAGLALAATLSALAAPRPAHAQDKPEVAGPYVPTPWVIVDEILKLAAIGPGDFVVDLGSGDGRLVITAAQKYGARGGFGVDIDESLVKLSNENAAKAGVGDRVRFHVRDLFQTDVSEASVVTLYLLPTSVPKLAPKLQGELRAGSRVVSHDYPLGDWPHERVVRMDVPEKVAISGTPRTWLYLYIVPARVAGTWALALPAAASKAPLELTLAQDVKGATGTVATPRGRAALAEVSVRGEEVKLALPPQATGKPLVLRGRIAGEAIEGTVEGLPGAPAWRATRRSR